MHIIEQYTEVRLIDAHLGLNSFRGETGLTANDPATLRLPISSIDCLDCVRTSGIDWIQTITKWRDGYSSVCTTEAFGEVFKRCRHSLQISRSVNMVRIHFGTFVKLDPRSPSKRSGVAWVR